MKKIKDRKAIEKIKDSFLNENKNDNLKIYRISSQIGYIEKNEYQNDIKQIR